MSDIEPAELLAQIDAGRAPAILDVRSATEFAAGHVPGARNVPFWAVWMRIAALQLDPARPLVVYCGHGPRAGLAAAALRRRGFRDLVTLRGHMAAWARAGLREERGSRG